MSAIMHEEPKTRHIPVLLDAVLGTLQPQKGERYLDLTAGYGGHASRVVARTEAPADTVLVDRDENAITALADVAELHGATLLHSDFYTASQSLTQAGRQFDVILADLGISSPHIDIAARGFAFGQDGPLDMRMDQRQSLTAETVVNTYSQDELVRLIKTYGEEPRAVAVARAIVAQRPVHTTYELATVVRSALPKRGKTDQATKTFQALRIAVNDELELLRNSLPLWFELLAPGGRLGVISFHSLEDRIVKRAIQEVAGERYDAELRLLTKRPITADETELVFNPRARSAKLRAVAKIKK